MGDDGMRSQQWPRSFSREDRPIKAIHCAEDSPSDLTLCGQPIRGRLLAELGTEATCVMCTRVALANMIIGRHLPSESP